MGGGSKAPAVRKQAPAVRESVSNRQSAAADERKKAKSRRGYESTSGKKSGTLLGGGSQEMGSKTLLG